MPKAKVNYALAGTLVASGMTFQEAASRCNAANGESLRRGLFRKGVTGRASRVAYTDRIVPQSVTMTVATQAAEHLKSTFNRILVKHVGSLEKIKPSSNLKKLKKIGEVIEPFARTYRTVNGEQGKPSLVNVQVLSNLNVDELPDTGAPLAVDVSSTVQEQPIKPANIEPNAGQASNT